jgi:hypothetical protein
MDEITGLSTTPLYSYSNCPLLVILSADELLITTTKEGQIYTKLMQNLCLKTELNYEISIISNRHMGEFNFVS